MVQVTLKMSNTTAADIALFFYHACCSFQLYKIFQNNSSDVRFGDCPNLIIPVFVCSFFSSIPWSVTE